MVVLMKGRGKHILYVWGVPTKLLRFTFLTVIMAEHNRRVSGIQQKPEQIKTCQMSGDDRLTQECSRNPDLFLFFFNQTLILKPYRF